MAGAELIARLVARRIVDQWKDETAQIKSITSEFSPGVLSEYNRRLSTRKKSMAMGYLSWMMMSHYLYTGKWLKQVIFWGTLGGVFLWWFLDMFLMYFVVDSYNRSQAFAVIEELLEEGTELHDTTDEPHQDSTQQATTSEAQQTPLH